VDAAPKPGRLPTKNGIVVIGVASRSTVIDRDAIG
jgi:hypothetical protein